MNVFNISEKGLVYFSIFYYNEKIGKINEATL
jgi:hypothetical protein